MDNYIEYKPTSSNIALFYQFNTQKEATNRFSLIPDGSIDIIFCCCPNNPDSFIWTSPLFRSEEIDLKEDCEYFGVRLFPEQKILNVKYSMKELLGKKIPLSEFLPVEINIEPLFIGRTFEEKIKLFEQYIVSLASGFSYHDVIDYSVKKIYSARGNLNITSLTNDTGYSDRYLRQKFVETIGFSPKQFSEMVRFQNSLAMIFEKKAYNSLDIVYENGYHDHSHFIKGFKKFTKLTPAQYVENISTNNSQGLKKNTFPKGNLLK